MLTDICLYLACLPLRENYIILLNDNSLLHSSVSIVESHRVSELKAQAQLVYLHSVHLQRLWQERSSPSVVSSFQIWKPVSPEVNLPGNIFAHVPSMAWAQFCIHITLSKHSLPLSPGLGSWSPPDRKTGESSFTWWQWIQLWEQSQEQQHLTFYLTSRPSIRMACISKC